MLTMVVPVGTVLFLLLAILSKSSIAFLVVGNHRSSRYRNIVPIESNNPRAAFTFESPRTVLSMVTTTTSSNAIHSNSNTVHGTNTPLGDPICEYHTVQIPIPGLEDASSSSSSSEQQMEIQPRQEIVVQDLTGIVQDLLKLSQIMAGTVTVISRHTTTSIVINERESRLFRDMARVFRNLVPPDERALTEGTPGIRYYHNDIDQRPESDDEAQRCRDNGWNIDVPEQLHAWRNQEPINAHSHLLSMLLGSSESIPVVHGTMVLGTWQSVLLVDLDGPRPRTVGIQIMGYTQPSQQQHPTTTTASTSTTTTTSSALDRDDDDTD